MAKFTAISAKRVAEAVGGTIVLDRGGDGGACEVTELGSPIDVGPGGLAFVIAEGFVKEIAATRAGVLVVQTALLEKAQANLPASVRVLISAADAYLGLARLSRAVAEELPLGDWRLPVGHGSSAAVHPDSKIDETARLAAGVAVGEGASIGARTVILPNVVIGPGVTIGTDCVLFPGVVLYPRVSLGNRVRIHANAVLGADGFGYAKGPQGSEKIWHLGRVVVEDDVEIGANTAIDRGTMKDTIIERGAKLDNLCQIGHNGHIRAHAILCAQVGLAGNVTVGRGAILAGKAGIADKLDIGDGAIIGPMTGLSKDAKPGEVYMGSMMARPRREWWRLLSYFDKLPELFDRVKKLERKQ